MTWKYHSAPWWQFVDAQLMFGMGLMMMLMGFYVVFGPSVHDLAEHVDILLSQQQKLESEVQNFQRWVTHHTVAPIAATSTASSR